MVKVGLSIHRLHHLGLDPSAYAAVARKAEEAGFESLWVGDHLVFPAQIPPTHPYSPDGRGPHYPGLPWFDPFITLTYLAAVTHRIRLATNIYLLPLRNPFVTARAVGTLDLMSGGRVTLGVGVGWLEPEFQAVGEDFHNRGKRTDEIIAVLKRLWTEETIEFRGRYYSFGPVKFEPKPVQRPHPPIHYGGLSPAALRRAATLCDGWIGVANNPEEVREMVATMAGLRRTAGRESQPFEVTVGSSLPPTADNLRRYEEAGATRVMVSPYEEMQGPQRVERALAGIERFAEEVLQRLGR